MPAVSSGKILVTGASGFVGAWIVKILVERGYSVVVAVRSQKHIDFITKRFPEYEGKVSGIIVANIEAPGAYDEAVRGVNGIIHAASPVDFMRSDPAEVIGPAIKGATGILVSAASFGKDVQRIVLTSSLSAITSKDEEQKESYDETEWNTVSPALVDRLGKDASVYTVYHASKALAERAAWDFMQREKVTFDLATVLPSFNFGPYIHEATYERGVGSTPGIFLSMFPDGDTSGVTAGNWVDVRDVATCHVLALSTPRTGGERISSTAGPYTWQDVYDVLIDDGYTSVPGKRTYGAGKNAARVGFQSNAKSLRLFPGFAYRSFEECVKDMGKSLVDGGFL